VVHATSGIHFAHFSAALWGTAVDVRPPAQAHHQTSSHSPLDRDKPPAILRLRATGVGS